MSSETASATARTPNQTFTLELHTNAALEGPVFVSGNFNNWAAETGRQSLIKVAPGQFIHEFPPSTDLPNPLEYKYHLGSWDSVELDRYGNGTPNRRVDTASQAVVEDRVEKWMRQGRFYEPEYLPHPRIISEEFDMPEMIKTRRVSVLLPHDYDRTDKHYPVLYLQDGQNLFDDYAPFGNWGVDKRLAMLAGEGMGDLIVVAIDHAEAERIEEFTPSFPTVRGRGEGRRYARFLTQTLKPYIDQHYRTRPEREHTGIGGSSMGGLISIYAGLLFPEMYSKLMIFSPSLWLTPNIRFHFINFRNPQDMKVYLYGGGQESKTMVPNLERFKRVLEQKAKASVLFNLSIDPEGQHNEARWGQEFPRAVSWLFFDKNVSN